MFKNTFFTIGSIVNMSFTQAYSSVNVTHHVQYLLTYMHSLSGKLHILNNEINKYIHQEYVRSNLNNKQVSQLTLHILISRHTVRRIEENRIE
jgi:hypothetical protein